MYRYESELQTLNGPWDTSNSGVGGGSGTGYLYLNPSHAHGSILTDVPNTFNAQVKCWARR